MLLLSSNQNVIFMKHYIQTITEAVHLSGKEILSSFNRLDKVKYITNGKRGVITEVDHKSEKIIIDLLRSRYPDYSFFGEEFEYDVDWNNENGVWVVDGLDGSNNFINGIPHFCISIALVKNSVPVLGVIYDPVRDELFLAQQGKSSLCNQCRVKVKKSVKLEDCLVSFSVHNDLDSLDYVKLLRSKGAHLRISGSTALDLAYIASGRLDLAIFRNVKPWDVAAGLLLVKQSGGAFSLHSE